jgi:phage N-6-adenine-methyltransferase
MSELWATPQALFDKLHEEFNFSTDVCALPENAKCDNYFTPEQDGLSKEWVPWNDFFKESVWMNPPYGREIEKWMKKAHETSLQGVRVVALIPNRSNAPWWHEYVMRATEIRFIKHKVAFDVPNPETDKGVPFWGSVIVVFGPGPATRPPQISTYLQPKHEKG